MAPRMGRPKLENAMDTRIGVRLDAETVRKLDEIAKARNESRSQVIRKCIEREYQDAQK